MNVLEIHALSKAYGSHTALSGIDLKVPKGAIFGLLGPNGAGKTTLIRIINQIIEAESGTVYFNNEPLKPSHVSHIGYLPEERGLYKKMKVGEQLLYFAQLKDLSYRDAKAKIDHWLDRLQISAWKNKMVEELSKGMAQKIQFIATVIHDPQLLILDEPFSGFDPVNAEIIKNEILALRDNGTTVIHSTHWMESVELLCDHIAMIHQSKKVIDGPVDEIRRSAKTNTFSVQLMKNGTLPDHQWSDYKEFQDHVSFSVPLNGAAPNDILRDLMQYGEVIGFGEVVPSIGDIFIQKVKESDHA